MPQPNKPFDGFTPAITRGTLEDLMLDSNEYHHLGAVEIFHGDDNQETVGEKKHAIKKDQIVYNIRGGFGKETITSAWHERQEYVWNSLHMLTEALNGKSYKLTKFDEKTQYHHGASSTHYVGDLYVKKS
jgi:hypothetical protein